MIRTAKFFAMASCIGLTVGCASINIVETTVPKANQAYPYAQVEPSIAIDPNDTNRMAIGAVLDEFAFSLDAGKTWHSQKLESPYGVYGDPVLQFDKTGLLYYFHLSHYPKATHLDRIVCQTSDDLKQFTMGTYPAPNGTKVQDKHWIAISPFDNTVHMTWTQFDAYDSEAPMDSSIILYAQSKDQGTTWTEPKRISFYAGDCLDDDLTVEGAMPAINAQGDVVVTWSGPKGLVRQISKDDGNTWLEKETLLFPHEGGWTFEVPGISRANGLPVLKSYPAENKMYLNWCAKESSSDKEDVWLSVSEDGGLNWSEPRKVNQDKPGSDQFFTWMDVDQSTGYVYFVYYDRRKSKENETYVYAACSKDYGETFQEIQLTATPFYPDQSVFFGDYLSIAAVNGCIRAVYPIMNNKQISLKVAHITANSFD